MCMWLRIRVASDHVSQRVHEGICTKSIHVCRMSVSSVCEIIEYVFKCMYKCVLKACVCVGVCVGGCVGVCVWVCAC